MNSRISWLLICLSSSLNSEPIVIYDSGRTMPTYAYKQILQNVQVPDFGKDWSTEKFVQVEPKKDISNPENWLPIKTQKLTPGKVNARSVQFNQLVSPVCVIGSDPYSIKWIKKHQKVLKDNNVLCWLVDANSIKDVQKIIKALDGISMTPADGDALSEFFSISHYPLLITQRFIEQ